MTRNRRPRRNLAIKQLLTIAPIAALSRSFATFRQGYENLRLTIGD
jgi:hypothetical protein